MDPPAHLPRTADDVEEWSVYADQLMTRGDPLGEQLAYELALPEHPTRDQIAAFHSACRRLPRSRLASATWCLRHVRTLHIGGQNVGLRARTGPSLASFESALRLVNAPSGRFLEEVVVTVGAEHLDGHLRLFAALPATCTKVTLDFVDATDQRVDETIAIIPAHVREVGLQVPHRRTAGIAARLVRDRFARIDLTWMRLSDAALAEVASALAATASVRAIVGNARGALHARMDLGDPRDAAFLAPEYATVVPRWSLHRLQSRYGVVPVRTQLAWLPEYDTYDVHQLAHAEVGEAGIDVTRRGDAWTVRYTSTLWIDEEPLDPKRVVPLPDGARLRIADRTVTFAATDADARYRAPGHGDVPVGTGEPRR